MPPAERSGKKPSIGASTKDGEDAPSSGRSGSWVSIRTSFAAYSTEDNMHKSEYTIGAGLKIYSRILSV